MIPPGSGAGASRGRPHENPRRAYSNPAVRPGMNNPSLNNSPDSDRPRPGRAPTPTIARAQPAGCEPDGRATAAPRGTLGLSAYYQRMVTSSQQVRNLGRIRSLERGLSILALFDKRHPEWTIGAISTSLDLPLASTYRIVNTLIAQGFLERHRSHGRVRLGLALLRLGSVVQSGLSLREVAAQDMQYLAQEVGETAVLMVPRDLYAVCVENIEGSYPIRPRSIGVGEHFPYHAGAVPLAIFAFLPHEQQQRVLQHGLPRLTHNSLHTPEEVMARCAQIKQSRISYSREEAIAKTAAVAAPIFGADDSVVLGAIGLTGVVERIIELDDVIWAAAQRISTKMGQEIARANSR